jgi:hypothetical protein
MNDTFHVRAKQLVEDAYMQHECSHGNFKGKYASEYEALTNAILAAAREELTAQELQDMNQLSTIQDMIKRMYRNTRNWKRLQQKRQHQVINQQQPGTTNSNSCKRQRTHALSGHTNAQPRASTPAQGHPPAKKQKLRAPTRNQFNRVTYAPYPMEELLSAACKEIGDTAAQQARTYSVIREEFTKHLNIRKKVEARGNH